MSLRFTAAIAVAQNSAMPTPADAIATLHCKNKKCWTNWLARHHAGSPGVWLQIAKKDSGLASIAYPEALEAALCQGWIDGQKKSLDAQSWLQKFTPRRPKSIWSKVNRDKAMALMAAGQMQAAGLAEVERAKADGRWDAAYDAQGTAAIPEDLAILLAGRPAARTFFEALDSRNRYAILFRLQTARKSATRERRLMLFVDMLSRGEKIHP